jgi:hypothetical protein
LQILQTGSAYHHPDLQYRSHQILVIEQDGQNSTQVQIRSSAGYEPIVQLPNPENRSRIQGRFEDNELVIPSHAVAITQLEVIVPSEDVKYCYTHGEFRLPAALRLDSEYFFS